MTERNNIKLQMPLKMDNVQAVGAVCLVAPTEEGLVQAHAGTLIMGAFFGRCTPLLSSRAMNLRGIRGGKRHFASGTWSLGPPGLWRVPAPPARGEWPTDRAPSKPRSRGSHTHIPSHGHHQRRHRASEPRERRQQDPLHPSLPPTHCWYVSVAVVLW